MATATSAGESAGILRRLLGRSKRGTEPRLVGPIRGELLGVDRLAAHARALARRQKLLPQDRRRDIGPMLRRLEETHSILHETRNVLNHASERHVDVSPAGDWLLENFYIIDEHVREIRRSMPNRYYRELPKLATGALAGFPRVYEVAIELIAHTEGHLDNENIDLYVREFQTGAELSIGELWAVPIMLRLGLMENIRRMALRVRQRLEQVESADRHAAALRAASLAGPRALGDALATFVQSHPPLTPAFVSRFLQRIRGYDTSFTPLVWLEEWIAEDGLPAVEAVARSNQHAALTQVMVANSITSLRTIGLLEWRDFFESQSRVERILRLDPTGDYARMTFSTRDRYRHIVERVARRTGHGERDIANRALRLAEAVAAQPESPERMRHIGYWLIDHGREALDAEVGYPPTTNERFIRAVSRHPDLTYLGTIIVLTLMAVAGVLAAVGPATIAGAIAVVVFTLLPANQLAVVFVNHLVTLLLPPRKLARLELREDGIPPELRTVVAVPTLFGDEAAVRSTLEHVEIQFLANRDPQLQFAILSDFTDAAEECMPEDDAILAAAVEGVRELNRRYDGKATFCLLHRPRRWNERQGIWMGWERKRGKLAELNLFLRGGANDAFTMVEGDVALLRGARYVITLDADTVLTRDAAQVLVGTIAHPLNRAVFNADRGRIVEGYGILQPRVSVTPTSAHRSRFAAIQSGQPGVDPYTTAVSDVYQDLYGEGIFAGKGIYDVDAFEEATHGRFPENRLLSHDLIEGTYVRAGLVTDVEVYDDYPTRYVPYTRRKHRWIRGDWQLLNWLGPRVPGVEGLDRNRLSRLSLWKIFDNLRRSVIEIAQLALLLAAWLILPGNPLNWSAAVILAVAFPWLLPMAVALVRPPNGANWRAYYEGILRDARVSAEQLALYLVFLAHQALISADAIVRTLHRLYVSKRNLLEWVTASQVERTTTGARSETWRAMRPALLLTGVIGVLVVARILMLGDAMLALGLAVAAVPLILFWGTAPAIANALSVPATPGEVRLPEAARELALRYALLHWRYFDRFVTEGTQWLAPDNFQETPAPVVADRTSPTNIGLHLLAIVTAQDLGFLTLDDMIARLERVFRTLERMQRFRGHFYNWYELRDLRVLEPRYVSTVDSGNLAGHLLALKQACLALPDQPLETRAVGEAARVALGLAAEDGDEAIHWESWGVSHPVRQRETLRDLGIPDEPVEASPTLRSLAATSARATEHIARLDVIAERAGQYAAEMDFTFLYDSRRRLFSIGYRESEGERDNSFYDLLASEARLTSFLAVAYDQIDVEHWFRLGRGLITAKGDMALVSWSGSMFEYLMPLLVMRSYPFTLLDETYRGAVRRQIAFGREHGAAWGVSESAYNVRDRNGTYQYRAFGVPDLALKRGTGRDLVVAPYATLLALPIEPRMALRNLQALEEEGALGPYGFRDAVDYTRPDDGRSNAIVRTYMAHHIGMGLVALDNALNRQVWQGRFHADPVVRSAELVLQERIPPRTIVHEIQPQEPDLPRTRSETEKPAVREIETPDTPQPRIALLGTHPYTVLLTNSGSGVSRFEDLAVTRWRNDATRDEYGQCCYVKLLDTGRFWSTAFQPSCRKADVYRVVFATDRVMFERRDGDIETRTEIAVVPDDHAEVRRVTVVNHGTEDREVELTSYGEIVLARPENDRMHPAFSNLFVETWWLAQHTAILASRRPRASDDPHIWCAHVAAVGSELVGEVTCETDRARFVGRGRTICSPAALDDGAELSGTTGSVLDPVFALRARIRVRPGRSARVAFTTLVAREHDRAIELADRYNDPYAAQRALDLSWTQAQVQLRDFGISPADASVFQELAGHLLFYNPSMRPGDTEFIAGAPARDSLWANGISGDWPVLLARIETSAGLPSVRQLLAAHQYWRLKGITVDLVIMTVQAGSYQQELADALLSLVLGSSEATLLDRPGGVFIRRMDIMPAAELAQLRATARVHVDCDGLGIGRMLDAAAPDIVYPRPFGTAGPAIAPPAERAAERTGVTGTPPSAYPVAGNEPAPLSLDNPWGGVNGDDDYEIRIGEHGLPPMPWANIIANEAAGFSITERGGGCTWGESSFFYRLTPWSNDPVCDPLGEIVYLRDEETGTFWCPTPGPVKAKSGYTVRHAPGRTTFGHERDGIATSLELTMAGDQPVKLSRLSVTNRGERWRHISVTSYVEWVLGVLREHTQHHVRTWLDETTGALMAQNRFEPVFNEHVAFTWISEALTSHTADRREFLGRNGETLDPAAMHRVGLAGRTGSSVDPCGAVQCVLELAPGQTKVVDLLLGSAASEQAARTVLKDLRTAESRDAARTSFREAWERRLTAVRVRTPSPAFDAIINRWALYQAVSCRVFGRTAIYQSSGAYGFRDQLQDVASLVYAEPRLARAHIVRSAGRQFVEGDVQHWWHPHTGRGIRTRFSDDLIWLPFITDHYVRTTGDTGVLDEEAPFLTMRELAPDEHEVYELPTESGEVGTVYEHCLRALRRGCTAGEHGVPLIGSGDWNDGMNRVGIGGKGESVWLAWFLIATLRRFADHCEARGDAEAASELKSQANEYASAVERTAWDGAWYKRAWFDDGAPLGSAENDECRIDNIAQSWSIISGGGNPVRTEQAMASLEEHLVREEDKLILLLTPPFDRMEHDPGYIKGYLPGVRENGGQYTHAALWTVLATALRGDGDRAFDLFQLINPFSHAGTPTETTTYKVEPYVVAADVYSAQGHVGRGGWTWYTGSAAWMYRVGLESILGFTLRADVLSIDPCIPRDWEGFSLEYRYLSSTYAIEVRNNGAGTGVREVTVDGRVEEHRTIPLRDDGRRHEVIVEMGEIGP